MISLGIDTSNYTTSAAFYNSDTGEYIREGKLLPVKQGEMGLRQSDAVFHHVIQLPEVIAALRKKADFVPDIISVSVSPRDAEGSYMPCFMTGKGTAEIMGDMFNLPVYRFSHQAGHIAAALLSADKLDIMRDKFLAFHVSGGTTEAVLSEPDKEKIMKLTPVASSLDLHAGQAIDRVGGMLGLKFPSGAELDRLSRQSNKEYKIHPFIKDNSCSLSGVENKCRKMLENGENLADIAKFCISYIMTALEKMTDGLTEKYPGLPLVYSGGVMSNSLIRERFSQKYNCVFASDGLSTDNAVGIACLGALKHNI